MAFTRRLPDREDGDIIAFAYATADEAQAAARLNREEYGHRAWVEYDADTGEWVELIDVRPAVAAIRAEYERNMASN